MQFENDKLYEVVDSNGKVIFTGGPVEKPEKVKRRTHYPNSQYLRGHNHEGIFCEYVVDAKPDDFTIRELAE